MPSNAADFQNLSNTIRNVGTDSLNQTLGIAKLMSDERLKEKELGLKAEDLASLKPVRESEVGLRKVQTETAQIGLNEAKKKEEFLNAPASFPEVYSFATQGASEQDKVRIAADLSDAPGSIKALSTFGITFKEPNNPNSGLLIAGKDATNRDIARIAPVIHGYFLTNSDIFKNMSTAMSTIKQELGAASPGPLLSPQEQITLSQDPNSQGLLAKYLDVKAQYDKYNTPSGRSIVYRDQLASLQQIRGVSKHLGGDTSALDERAKVLEEAIKKSEGEKVISPKVADALGLPKGTEMPDAQAGALGTGMLTQQAQAATNETSREVALINERSQNYTADKHLLATQANIAKENVASQRNMYTITMEKTIPERVDNFIEKTMKNPAGQIIDQTTNEVMAPEKLLAFRESLAAKEKQKFAQRELDTMGPQKFTELHGQIPPGLDMSPPLIREEFKNNMQGILDSISKIPDKDATGASLKSQVIQGLTAIRNSVRSGNPQAIEKAKQDLVGITVQVKQYFDQQKANIPKKVNEAAKTAATTPLPRNRGLRGLGTTEVPWKP